MDTSLQMTVGITHFICRCVYGVSLLRIHEFQRSHFRTTRGGMVAWVLRRDVEGEDEGMKLGHNCVSSAHV